jgi:hypothetical protein
MLPVTVLNNLPKKSTCGFYFIKKQKRLQQEAM